jgi:endo-beta-N-acetylglucosaminidase D
MLGNAEFSYNNSPHLITGVSPFYALYSFHSNIGYFINEEVSEGEVPTAQERVEEIMKMRKTLLKQLLNASEYQLKWYDIKHKNQSYALDD